MLQKSGYEPKRVQRDAQKAKREQNEGSKYYDEFLADLIQYKFYAYPMSIVYTFVFSVFAF